MNYLGHLVLAEQTDEGLLGAIMGDFVKGPLVGQYPREIERAISLHRRIDAFTDAHEAVRVSRGRVSPPRRRYAGILIDIFFDHFLVRHWNRYGHASLDSVVERIYRLLLIRNEWMPGRLQSIAPRMVEQDWLRSYGERHAVETALSRMSKRLRRGEPLATGIAELDLHYSGFETDFHRFLPAAINFARALTCH
jgi:acyl carrier protein phosphodiesterase